MMDFFNKIFNKKGKSKDENTELKDLLNDLSQKINNLTNLSIRHSRQTESHGVLIQEMLLVRQDVADLSFEQNPEKTKKIRDVETLHLNCEAVIRQIKLLASDVNMNESSKVKLLDDMLKRMEEIQKQL